MADDVQSTDEANEPLAERMYNKALYVSFMVVYDSSMTLLMRLGMERLFSVADRISRQMLHAFSVTDACSSAMEKVKSKAVLDASATEHTSSGMEDNFSKGIHVASDPDKGASAAESSNSTGGSIASFTEQVSFVWYVMTKCRYA